MDEAAAAVLADAAALVREHMAVLGPAQAASLFAVASGIAARVTERAYCVELDELLTELSEFMRSAAEATHAVPTGRGDLN